jgi:hypothetical protein
LPKGGQESQQRQEIKKEKKHTQTHVISNRNMSVLHLVFPFPKKFSTASSHKLIYIKKMDWCFVLLTTIGGLAC